MSLILDGTNGLTFNNATTQASAGVVLQVVQGQLASTTGTTTTSSSYVTTGLTASITPKFSTSKILITICSSITQTSTGKVSYYTVYRNSTNLGGGTNSALALYDNELTSGTLCWVPLSINYLDSPATTSSTTYTLYLSTDSGGTAYATYGKATSTITLMEIAG